MRLVIAILLLATCAWASDALPDRVEAFVQPRLQTPASGESSPDATATILARPDPGTLFLYYAYGLKRNAGKVLTADQAGLLDAVIATHSPTNLRWHDERNTLRCKFTQLLWLHAAAGEPEAQQLHAELETWMRLRMAWTEQEHLARYRFARAVWEILTPGQRGRILAGEWKGFAKQDTGHARADLAAALITRALGKPDNASAFESAVAAWSLERAPLQAAFIAADTRERQFVFAMDLNSEPLVHAANQTANAAFAQLYLAEADAIRRIVQAAYVHAETHCARAAGAAWDEAPKRFKSGATELISLLSAADPDAPPGAGN